MMKQSSSNSNTQEDDVDEFFGNQSESSDEEGEEERFYCGYEDRYVYQHQQKQQQEKDMSRCSLSQHECQSQRQHFHKLGYHEAYDACKDDNLQVGFEDGLMENMDHAFKIGQLLGTSTCTSTYGFSTAERQQQQQQEIILIGQLDPSEEGSRRRRSASNENDINYFVREEKNAAFLVREFLEKEQVRDGSSCDKNNQELDMLTQNLEELMKLKS